MKVTLELTDGQIETFHSLTNKAYASSDIPDKEYEILYLIAKAINDVEVQAYTSNLVAQRLTDVKAWADEKCTCKHEGHDHALAGVGLCVSEGCPCMKFTKSP